MSVGPAGRCQWGEEGCLPAIGPAGLDCKTPACLLLQKCLLLEPPSPQLLSSHPPRLQNTHQPTHNRYGDLLAHWQLKAALRGASPPLGADALLDIVEAVGATQQAKIKLEREASACLPARDCGSGCGAKESTSHCVLRCMQCCTCAVCCCAVMPSVSQPMLTISYLFITSLYAVRELLGG